jgi:hypothetical protein
MVNEARFKNTQVLKMVRNCDRERTRTASEPRALVAQFARTGMGHFSFMIQVTEPWNSLPTKLKNAKDSKAFRRMRKKTN